jgi:hypothetical protein
VFADADSKKKFPEAILTSVAYNATHSSPRGNSAGNESLRFLKSAALKVPVSATCAVAEAGERQERFLDGPVEALPNVVLLFRITKWLSPPSRARSNVQRPKEF